MSEAEHEWREDDEIDLDMLDPPSHYASEPPVTNFNHEQPGHTYRMLFMPTPLEAIDQNEINRIEKMRKKKQSDVAADNSEKTKKKTDKIVPEDDSFNFGTNPYSPGETLFNVKDIKNVNVDNIQYARPSINLREKYTNIPWEENDKFKKITSSWTNAFRRLDILPYILARVTTIAEYVERTNMDMSSNLIKCIQADVLNYVLSCKISTDDDEKKIRPFDIDLLLFCEGYRIGPEDDQSSIAYKISESKDVNDPSNLLAVRYYIVAFNQYIENTLWEQLTKYVSAKWASKMLDLSMRVRKNEISIQEYTKINLVTVAAKDLLFLNILNHGYRLAYFTDMINAMTALAIAKIFSIKLYGDDWLNKPGKIYIGAIETTKKDEDDDEDDAEPMSDLAQARTVKRMHMEAAAAAAASTTLTAPAQAQAKLGTQMGKPVKAPAKPGAKEGTQMGKPVKPGANIVTKATNMGKSVRNFDRADLY